MTPIITVENLSKSYVIHHEGRERYTALRDVLARQARALANALARPFAAPSRVDTEAGSSSRETFWALNDVSFEVERGERLGIIGRNGAGKSTLLKILSRITYPTKGKVTLRGRVASLLEVGTGFHPELTGRENIYLNGAVLGMGRAEIRKKFDEIVAFAEVDKFLDTPVKRYSSGMYVRLAFAVAAHLEPEILLVDEVLAVGDAQFQKKCLGKMEEISKGQGRTVLFVSHNIGAVHQLCGSVIWVHSGRVKAAGAVAATVRAYLQEGGGHGTVDLGGVGTGQARDVTFFSAAVLDSAGTPNPEVPWNEPVRIQVSYVVSKRVPALEIGIQVHSSTGIPVFTSSLSEAGAGEPFAHSPGTYTVTATIAARFLLPGNYTLTLGAHEPMVQVYDARYHALSFAVYDTGSTVSRYVSAELGVVCAPVVWARAEPQAPSLGH